MTKSLKIRILIFCGHMLFFGGKYLGVGLLGHSMDVCLTFLEAVCLPNWYHFALPPVMYESSSFSTPVIALGIV